MSTEAKTLTASRVDTRKLATMAMLVALAYIVTVVTRFPLIGAAPYLKSQMGNRPRSRRHSRKRTQFLSLYTQRRQVARFPRLFRAARHRCHQRFATLDGTVVQ